MAAGFLWNFGYQQVFIRPASAMSGSQGVIEAEVMEYPQETDYGLKTEIRIKTDHAPDPVAMLYMYFGETCDLVPGDVIRLEAELLLCQLELPELRQPLSEVLELARKLLRWEVLEEPAEPVLLGGLDDAQLRSHSHRPQDYYGQPHFMPSVSDGEAVLRLNRLRTQVRAAERAAALALPQRADLLQALNRMSSFLYILMIREKAKAGEELG